MLDATGCVEYDIKVKEEVIRFSPYHKGAYGTDLQAFILFLLRMLLYPLF